jgi:hypothetical protein
MHSPETKIVKRCTFYATNQVHENQCIRLTGEFHVVKQFLASS